uniref:Uncharacterized protein n=1 Tax=Anopheles atroparvus TaxID=41427 RepID=A0A182IWW1_ANOAO
MPAAVPIFCSCIFCPVAFPATAAAATSALCTSCWCCVVPGCLFVPAAATAAGEAALSAGSRFCACACGCELTTLTGEKKVNEAACPLKLPAPVVPITCLPVVVSICGAPWNGFEVINWNCCWPASDGNTLIGCVPGTVVACWATCAGLWDFSSVSGKKSYVSSKVMPAFSASVSRHFNDRSLLLLAGGTVPLPVRTIVVVPLTVRSVGVGDSGTCCCCCCCCCSGNCGPREDCMRRTGKEVLCCSSAVTAVSGESELGATVAAAGD